MGLLIIIIIGMLFCVALICYCALAVASEANEQEEAVVPTDKQGESDE